MHAGIQIVSFGTLKEPDGTGNQGGKRTYFKGRFVVGEHASAHAAHWSELLRLCNNR